jgi:hypothetical protein
MCATRLTRNVGIHSRKELVVLSEEVVPGVRNAAMESFAPSHGGPKKNWGQKESGAFSNRAFFIPAICSGPRSGVNHFGARGGVQPITARGGFVRAEKSWNRVFRGKVSGAGRSCDSGRLRPGWRRKRSHRQDSGQPIAAVGITNQRETTLIWAARPDSHLSAISWADRRTSDICDRLRKEAKRLGSAQRRDLCRTHFFGD